MTVDGATGRLVVFCGLPGVGKSSMSRRVADRLGATSLRIDTIEAAIVSTLMPFEGNPVGYVVAARVAADQLRAGRSVVADAVNGVTERRRCPVTGYRHGSRSSTVGGIHSRTAISSSTTSATSIPT